MLPLSFICPLLSFCAAARSLCCLEGGLLGCLMMVFMKLDFISFMASLFFFLFMYFNMLKKVSISIIALYFEFYVSLFNLLSTRND